MLNKKGFTLIEMLAVVVILSLIMSISIVSVDKYIKKSKKKSYVAIANEYMVIASNMLAKQQFVMRDSNTVYYIHINNLDSQKKLNKSPYAKWVDAYVVVTLDAKDNHFTFYWTSVDQKGYRINLVEEKDLNYKAVYKSKDLLIDTDKKIGSRQKIVVYDKEGNKITK